MYTLSHEIMLMTSTLVLIWTKNQSIFGQSVWCNNVTSFSIDKSLLIFHILFFFPSPNTEMWNFFLKGTLCQLKKQLDKLRYKFLNVIKCGFWCMNLMSWGSL